jgi:hypothetical protein
MPIVAKDPGGGDFDPAPAGQHAVVCCDVYDMGLMDNPFKEGQKIHKILIYWMMSECMDDGRPFLITQIYTLSLHEKANLRRDLESWRGQTFSEKELEGFDLEKLIGVPALVNVIHVPGKRDNKIRARLSSIMGLPKAMEAPAIHPEYVRKKDRQGEASVEPRSYEPDEEEPPMPDDDEVPF